VAERYGMSCLLHEKPFAGINGSGKHVNFSLGNASEGNLLDPGDTPHANAQFLVFCAAIIRAVDVWASVLRAVVASAGNDHRLGANEAPPAIISIFLGEQLTAIFEQIAKGETASSAGKGHLTVGVDTLPPLPKDAGDRNRTSPFAFCGNRFEFRAVGSNQSIAGPLVAINTIVTESLDVLATEIEAGMAAGDELHAVVRRVLGQVMRAHGRVIFNGDGYSAAWHHEAESRGLPNLHSAVDALPMLESEDVIELFGKYEVLSAREVASRVEVYLEQYCLSVAVEARSMIEMARTIIFPAAIRYQGELASTTASMQACGREFATDTLDTVAGLVMRLQQEILALEAVTTPANGAGTLAHARHCREAVLPAMVALRATADSLESLVADDLWPLATYQEMLFIK
jgi:glutamine synthetase